MQGRLSVDSLKSAGNGPIHSPVSNPIKNKTKQKRQANKQNTPKHNNTKNQTRHREVGSLPALRNKMHDDILCVILSMATENEAKRRQHRTTKKGPCKRVKEATKLNAETGDPPSQDPRDHREQPFRHNVHPGTSKQKTLRRVATRVVKNE